MSESSPVGPIDWAGNPQLTERALAVMLLQNHRGWQRQPSQGDAGVDVVRPLNAGYEVIQIRSHTAALTPGQKAKLARSFRQVLDDPELDRPVVAWRLLMPLNPTKEADVWFRELTTDAQFECTWWGRAHVERLASDNPHVVDWYFRDGRARLESRMRDLRRAASILDEPYAPLRAGEVFAPMEALIAAINRDDPHYAYYIQHSPEPPTLATEGDQPGIVLAVSRSIAIGGYLTTRVFAKHSEATNEYPVPLRFALALPDDDEELRQQVEDAFGFGSEVTLPFGVVRDLHLGAPGGLDHRSNEAAIRISGLDDEPFVPFRLRLRASTPDGTSVAETVVQAPRRTRGTRGLDVYLDELEGTFSVVVRLDLSEAPSLKLRQLSLGPPSQAVRRILPGYRLLHALHERNQLRLVTEFGEKMLASVDIGDQEPPVPSSYLTILEQLDVIQGHCSVSLLAPEEVTRSLAREIARVSHLLAGETVEGKWRDSSVRVPAGEIERWLGDVLAGPGLEVEERLTLRLGTQQVDFDVRYIRKLRSVRVLNAEEARRKVSACDPDEFVAIQLAPGEDDSFESHARPPVS